MSGSVRPYVKPHLTIGTLGHAGHGKSTLAAAFTRAPGGPGTPPTGRSGPPRRRSEPPEPQPRPQARSQTEALWAEYETDTRRYTHLEMPSGPGLLATAGVGVLDGAVLAVSVLDGVRPQTTEHVLLAHLMGVEHLVVALTKSDEGEDELTELVELDVRALLNTYGFAGDTLPVLRVSAERALAGDPLWTGSIEALLDAVDTYVPQPERDTAAPLILPVTAAAVAAGRGARVAGTVERGTVKIGDRLRAYAPDGPVDVRVAEVETGGAPAGAATAGEAVTLLLTGPAADLRGAVLAPAGSLTSGRCMEAGLRLLTAAEGGRDTPLRPGTRAGFQLRTATVPGVILLGGREPGLPGGEVEARVRLDTAVPLESGLRFAVGEGGATLAVGRVTRIAPETGVLPTGAPPSQWDGGS
ncbi:GTP-binding protein [Streptomyces axinellae]|uniref:Elongation factor Tu n=1 Tax=Streptomyces axinellae TaxID=552788 RepID=A0ABN3Q8V9_9ACTN